MKKDDFYNYKHPIAIFLYFVLAVSLIFFLVEKRVVVGEDSYLFGLRGMIFCSVPFAIYFIYFFFLWKGPYKETAYKYRCKVGKLDSIDLKAFLFVIALAAGFGLPMISIYLGKEIYKSYSCFINEGEIEVVKMRVLDYFEGNRSAASYYTFDLEGDISFVNSPKIHSRRVDFDNNAMPNWAIITLKDIKTGKCIEKIRL